MEYRIELRAGRVSGPLRGWFGPYSSKRAALREAQVMADHWVTRGVLVVVKPAAKRRKRNPDLRGSWTPVVELDLHGQLSTRSKTKSRWNREYGYGVVGVASKDPHDPARRQTYTSWVLVDGVGHYTKGPHYTRKAAQDAADRAARSHVWRAAQAVSRGERTFQAPR